MSSPLYERIHCKNTLHRLTHLIILFLLLSLLLYRLPFLTHHGPSITWFLAFLCESWFTFTWLLATNCKWNPVKYIAHSEHLLTRIDELPPVDMFVTTADPVLEPPIIVVNTVLSLLAVDYPTNKLACYISDDGASPVTFYSLVETVQFAKLWIPFCKKHNIQVRAPFRYFSCHNQPQNSGDISAEFLQEWTQMKNEYKILQQKIEEAQSSPTSYYSEIFSNVERRNHPSIIKVLCESKEGLEDGVPHVVYVSREKKPKHPHNFKAGALNVLARVSAVMTNSPIMLNVDCDMFVNNPKVAVDSMCFLLGTKEEKESGFVQFPQLFYGCDKDDPFGNQMTIGYEYIVSGVAGIQGPYYGGTGCFHRRKVMYGLSPDELLKPRTFSLSNGKSLEELKKIFGQSIKLVEYAAKSLSGLNNEGLCCPSDISSSLEEAVQVADVTYEANTEWGAEVGWRYGSTTEDMQTGLKIHSKGWRSIYYKPHIPGFLGSAPSSGPTCMVQAKRWSTGLLEILFTSNNPILGVIFGKLLFRQCLACIYVLLWAARSLAELCYLSLLAYCLLSNTPLFPSVSEPAILIPTFLFLIYNIYTLIEYLSSGLSARAWWNNQRMSRIISTTAWFFGFLSVFLKLLRLSETVFEVTPKDPTNNTTDNGDDSNKKDKKIANSGSFTFDDSPVFVLGTTIVLVHLAALALALGRLLMLIWWGDSLLVDQNGAGLGEIICSAWVVLSFLPFVKGLFKRGKYGIPSSTIGKSVALAGVFFQLCKWASKD